MNLHKLGLIALSWFTTLTACTSNKEYKYLYKGEVVRRVDLSGKSYFYKGSSSPKVCVMVDYHEYGTIMDGYLVFNRDNTVSIIGAMGYFKLINKNCGIDITAIANPDFISWHDSISGRYQNVCRIISDDKMQEQDNVQNKSDVQIIKQ